MTNLVSSIVSQADRLPIVGTPISSAAAIWSQAYKDASSSVYDQSDVVSYRLAAALRYASATPPPPPYEKVASTAAPSTLSRLSNYVWKRYENKPSVTAENAVAVVDRKQVEQAVALINIATEMDQSGNRQMALDLYMMGLDRMLSALPLDVSPDAKRALETKIKELKDRNHLDLGDHPNIVLLADEEEEAARNKLNSCRNGGLSDILVNALVYGAVALKKSPLPDMISSVIACAKAGLRAVDDSCQIRKRTWDIASHGIAKAAELDRQYEVHQMFSDALYTACTALIKAGIAYAETPGYKESRQKIHETIRHP